MTIMAAARNGNTGVVPPYLATPGVPHPPRETTAPSAHGRTLVPTLSRSEIARNLTGIDLQIPKGMQPLTDAARAADVVASTPRTNSVASASTVGSNWDYNDFDRGASSTRSEQEAAMATLKGVQTYFTQLGVGKDEGNGGRLPVVFKSTFPNAAYALMRDGREALIIGNDPDTGVSYAGAKDVLAHEYSHRVVNNMLGLKTKGEPGAVNESLADTFAAAVDSDDWLIGEDVREGGLRSMEHPERDQDALQDQYGEVLRMPGNYRDFVHTRDDNGGVHINVGIPNKAAANIGKALGRDTMAQIYVDAIRNYMTPSSGIADTARATLAATKDRFGHDSHEFGAVVDAWKSVGLVARTRR